MTDAAVQENMDGSGGLGKEAKTSDRGTESGEDPSFL